MAELIELNSNIHPDLKLKDHCSIEFAARQHVLHVRAAEIGKTISSFPVFFSRSSSTGGWILSAITGLIPGRSLFVEDQKWQGLYEPTSMQVYPFYLMQTPHDNNQYTVGFDPNCEWLGDSEGTALFDKKGQPSMLLKSLTSILEADLKHDVQSSLFVQHLDGLGLTKEISISVQFEDKSIQTITGLHTVNEERMQTLTAKELQELNQKGYLMLVHGMLLSIFQLNALIKRHNRINPDKPIKQIKLEVPKNDGVISA